MPVQGQQDHQGQQRHKMIVNPLSQFRKLLATRPPSPHHPSIALINAATASSIAASVLETSDLFLLIWCLSLAEGGYRVPVERSGSDCGRPATVIPRVVEPRLGV
jgi:hypothetical protein